MLPAARRLVAGADHREVARRGRRARRGPVVVVTLAAPALAGVALRPAVATVVAPKRVGGSVVRKRVQRRLRHLLAARIGSFPDGSRTVVRAEAGSAGLTSGVLAGHLDAALVTLGLMSTAIPAAEQA